VFLSLLSSLSFYCYAKHRDLHSFPTRRSSDLTLLPSDRGKPQDCSCSGVLDRVFFIEHVQLHDVEGRRVSPLSKGLQCRCAYQPDRKSTRLNSSHVSISYAVFCLKKKR